MGGRICCHILRCSRKRNVNIFQAKKGESVYRCLILMPLIECCCETCAVQIRTTHTYTSEQTHALRLEDFNLSKSSPFKWCPRLSSSSLLYVSRRMFRHVGIWCKLRRIVFPHTLCARFVSFSITACSYEIITQFGSKSYTKPWPNTVATQPLAIDGAWFGLLCGCALHTFRLKMTLESMPSIITFSNSPTQKYTS